VEFEPTTPAFEQAMTVLALDRAATLIGSKYKRTMFLDLASELLEKRSDEKQRGSGCTCIVGDMEGEAL
jgi:hypothetical protein